MTMNKIQEQKSMKQKQSKQKKEPMYLKVCSLRRLRDEQISGPTQQKKKKEVSQLISIKSEQENMTTDTKEIQSIVR